MARHFDAAIVTVAALLFPSVALGGEITFLARCDPPKGVRIDYGRQTSLDGSAVLRPEDGPRTADDGYENSWPVFYVNRDDPRTMISVWQNSAPRALPGTISPEATRIRATILRQSASEVAVMEIGLWEVWTYVFFPRAGAAFFSRMSEFPLPTEPADAAAFGAVYFSRCEFN